jgi:hypothetical protein
MLCSGSTIGTKKRMLDYLNAMHTAFDTLRCFPDGGIDQGYHNWVWLKRELEPSKVFVPGEDGPLMTVGSVADFTRQSVPEKFRTVLRRDKNGYVVNKDGRVIGTLHQWDRMMSHFSGPLKGTDGISGAGWLEQTLLGEGAGGVDTSPVMIWKPKSGVAAKGVRDAAYLRSLNVPRSEYYEWYVVCSFGVL